MEVIFSKEFQRQLEIVRKIADKGNIDFWVLYNRIGLCVKALGRLIVLMISPLN